MKVLKRNRRGGLRWLYVFPPWAIIKIVRGWYWIDCWNVNNSNSINISDID